MNNTRMQDRLTVASTIGATAAAGALIGLAAKYALGFSGYTMSPGELGAILGRRRRHSTHPGPTQSVNRHALKSVGFPWKRTKAANAARRQRHRGSECRKDKTSRKRMSRISKIAETNFAIAYRQGRERGPAQAPPLRRARPLGRNSP